MEAIDNKLEAKISLSKGWHRARTKEEMRTGFRRLAKLIGMRSNGRIIEMEREIFEGDI